MYHPRTPSKPWTVRRNYARFLPDKMRSERHEWRYRRYGRSAVLNEDVQARFRKAGNDDIYIRMQRRQQRRLNRWLADPDCPEWEGLS